jgi:hypothetical protein
MFRKQVIFSMKAQGRFHLLFFYYFNAIQRCAGKTKWMLYVNYKLGGVVRQDPVL